MVVVFILLDVRVRLLYYWEDAGSFLENFDEGDQDDEDQDRYDEDGLDIDAVLIGKS